MYLPKKSGGARSVNTCSFPMAQYTKECQIVGINVETVTNITSTDFPGHYPGEDHTWSLGKFEEVP